MDRYNILIVDDTLSHAQFVRDALVSLGFDQSNIFPALNTLEEHCRAIRSFAEKQQFSEMYFYISDLIDDKDISAIFLDLNHDPSNHQDTPINSSGEKLANNLLKNPIYKELPICIYTRYAKEKINLSLINASNVMVIAMGETTTSFTDANFVLDKFNENRFSKNDFDLYVKKYLDRNYHFNLSIICALPEEFKYVKSLSSNWKTKKINKHTYDTTWFRNAETGQNIHVIAQCMNTMGMAEASAYSAMLIERSKPQYIAMSGICAGIDKQKLQYGDVLIPEQVWNWQAGKFKVTDDTKTSIFDRSYLSHRLTTTLHKGVTTLLNSDRNFIQELVTTYKVNPNKPSNCHYEDSPKIYSNFLVSGSAVVADKKISDGLTERNLLGIDMESYGVFEAASHFPNVDAIVIKSVCDFADENKNDHYHDFASYLSASVLYELFMNHIEF